MLLELGDRLVLGKLFVADITALKERRVRAQAENMVICELMVVVSQKNYVRRLSTNIYVVCIFVVIFKGHQARLIYHEKMDRVVVRGTRGRHHKREQMIFASRHMLLDSKSNQFSEKFCVVQKYYIYLKLYLTSLSRFKEQVFGVVSITTCGIVLHIPQPCPSRQCT